MWMKAKTNCEIVPPNPDMPLEAGYQNVNNGLPVDGAYVNDIDTSYIKNYSKKVRDFPMKVMKTQLAFNKMSVLPRLLGLFKCMDKYCTNIFSSKEEFIQHLKLHSSYYSKLQKRKRIYNVEQFKMCAYCFKVFDDEESLANHIDENYSFCGYFCPHCFYRAFSASHVFVHQSIVHTYISKRIIKLDAAPRYPQGMVWLVDFKKFILPYKCNIGVCDFSGYLFWQFLEHLHQEHRQCDKYSCYICANEDGSKVFLALQPSSMIPHFKLHNINQYQCIFCLFGTEIIDLMIKHLAFEHFEYDSLCLERSTVSDNCESKDIENLKILRLSKVIEDRISECPNVPSDAMKSSPINGESQPSDTIVNTVFDSVQIEEINCTEMQKPLRIESFWSLAENTKNQKLSSNDDNEDEVDLSEKDPTC